MIKVAVNCFVTHNYLFLGGLISGLILLMVGCERTPPKIEHPGLPQHSLTINGDVNFRSSTSWDATGDSLSTKILAENTGENQAEVRTGPCSFTVLAYTLDENERKLVWTNRMPDNYICHDEMLVYTIEPGESVLLDGLMHISGKEWRHDIPKGEWQFVLEAAHEIGQIIRASSNRIVID